MFQAIGQRGALDVFHNHDELVVGGECGSKRSDIGMVETGHEFDLAQETSGQLLSSEEVRQQNLHGFNAIGDHVSHAIDLAHASAAQFVENLIVANPLVCVFAHG